MRFHFNTDDAISGTLGFGCFGFCLTMLVAWITHFVWFISTLAGAVGITGGQLLLGLLGSIIFPVGILHGIMIWFGSGM